MAVGWVGSCERRVARWWQLAEGGAAGSAGGSKVRRPALVGGVGWRAQGVG